MTVSIDYFLADVGEERRAAIEAGAAEIVAEQQTLAAVRKARGLTQAQVAAAMETSQANVAQIEKKSDALVSTVSRVVRAMGGRLKLIAEFDDGNHVPLTVEQNGEISLGGAVLQSALMPKIRQARAENRFASPHRQSSSRNEFLTARLKQFAGSRERLPSRNLEMVSIGKFENVGLSSGEVVMARPFRGHVVEHQMRQAFEVIHEAIAVEVHPVT